MTNRNISDLIEEYLKESLEACQQIQIRRSEMASLFKCVPSQINYVINTRFTVPKGYRVESKRGGGGYIKIVKVNLIDESNVLYALNQMVKERLTEDEAYTIIKKLYDYAFLTHREGELLLTMFSKKALNGADEPLVRSRLVKALIERLTYEDKE